MRKNYKLKLFTALVVAGVSIGGANAIHPTLTPTAIIAENSDNWTLIKSENGIEFSLLETTSTGIKYVKVKIKNNNSNSVNVTWSLKDKDGKVLILSTNKIEANGSHINYNRMVELKSNQTIADFSVEVNKLEN